MATDQWVTAQQHEQRYYRDRKNIAWNTPHSLEYWKRFLYLDHVNGVGLDVGCGPNGIYNFTTSVIGVDSINYRRRNFVVGVSERLPFRRVDYIICCNAIDHFQNPSDAFREMTAITQRIILMVNIYPQFVRTLIKRFDRTHPHLFTERDILKLVESCEVTRYVNRSIMRFRWEHAMWSAKLKLLFAYLFGIRSLCLHLEVHHG